ncbi:MerC domain-containing protein [Ferruginibacter sp. SUN002]|uniref:MerC domain-containing protein n=1 Tax=Ferruginibacter sp. SUN002 TaxID=2937789 RepID=UPI003D35E0B4
MALKLNWDALGIGTSVACAIHCAVLPIMATSLPVFGVNIIHNAVFEWGMIAMAFAIGSYSLYHGHIKHHRSFLPIAIFTIGFLFLILKQFLPTIEVPLLIIAVLMIISAHYYNYRLCHRSKCSSPHHSH